MEHDERAEQLEQEADKLEEHASDVGRRIDETRKDWESKQESQEVPGAQPPPEDESADDESPANQEEE